MTSRLCQCIQQPQPQPFLLVPADNGQVHTYEYTIFTSNRVLATSSNRVHTVHFSTCSSPTPSTVLLCHMCDVTRRQTVGSSYPRVKQSILFACRRTPVHKERPYHRSTFVYTMFAMLYVAERPQLVTLVQPSNRFGCHKVPYTDVFLSLEQANIISETVDNPYHTNVQTSTRHLGSIATFPTSCLALIHI